MKPSSVLVWTGFVLNVLGIFVSDALPVFPPGFWLVLFLGLGTGMILVGMIAAAVNVEDRNEKVQPPTSSPEDKACPKCSPPKRPFHHMRDGR